MNVDTDPTNSYKNNETKRALVIAISDYGGRLRSIDYCINDGNEMVNILTGLGYNISDRYKLIGKVDSSTLRKAIFSFFQYTNIHANDTILFYFSGHGIPDDTGKVFLASSETNPEIPSMDGFSFDDLAYLFDKKCPSLRKVMILDCCYSGAAEIGKGVGTTEKESEINETNKSRSILEEKSTIIEQGEGKYLLAASQGYPEAYDLKEKGHSIFTYFLLEGLKGHAEAVNNDGYVTPETIGKFVHRKIVSLPSERRPKQTPLRKGEVSGADIVLASYPDLRKKKEPDIYKNESTEKIKQLNIFISKPSTLNQKQILFFKELEDFLKDRNMKIRNLGTTDYSYKAPMLSIKDILNECSGAIILGMIQLRINKGIEKEGTVKERKIFNKVFPTPWNHIEAGMALMTGLPTLIICENGIDGGIFDNGVSDNFIHRIELEVEWFKSTLFIKVFDSWSRDVLNWSKRI